MAVSEEREASEKFNKHSISIGLERHQREYFIPTKSHQTLPNSSCECRICLLIHIHVCKSPVL